MRDGAFWWVMALMVLIVVGSGIWTISEANKCADKGGVYITGKSWPMCLKVESL